MESKFFKRNRIVSLLLVLCMALTLLPGTAWAAEGTPPKLSFGENGNTGHFEADSQGTGGGSITFQTNNKLQDVIGYTYRAYEQATGGAVISTISCKVQARPQDADSLADLVLMFMNIPTAGDHYYYIAAFADSVELTERAQVLVHVDSTDVYGHATIALAEEANPKAHSGFSLSVTDIKANENNEALPAVPNRTSYVVECTSADNKNPSGTARGYIAVTENGSTTIPIPSLGLEQGTWKLRATFTYTVATNTGGQTAVTTYRISSQELSVTVDAADPTPTPPSPSEVPKVSDVSFIMRDNKPVGASWKLQLNDGVEAPSNFTIYVIKGSDNAAALGTRVYMVTAEILPDNINDTPTYSHHFGADSSSGKQWNADSLEAGKYYVIIVPGDQNNGAASSPEWTKEASSSGTDTPVDPNPPVIPDIPFTPSTPSTGDSGTSGSTATKPSTPGTDTADTPDGGTTTTKTDAATGTVTETTKGTDGSETVVETRTDGTVTTTATDAAGNKTATTANPDGSSVTTIANKDGGASTTTVSASGQVTASVTAPAAAVEAAQTSGQAVSLPMPEVPLTTDASAAPTITIATGSGQPVKVEIPVEKTTPGTVAVIVKADGTEEVVKTSLATESGVTLAVPDGATVKIVDNSKSFADTAAHWAGDAITFAAAHELFTGTGADSFTPNGTMTRGMMVTVLARYDGVDTSAGATWYEKGVEWAAANGISSGADLDTPVSREQLAAMLYRYAAASGLDTTASGALTGFADAGSVSDYAAEAMVWAVGAGLIGGTDKGELNPTGSATRAEVAAILMRFCENVMK